MKQTAFASLAFDRQKKPQAGAVLSGNGSVVPWQTLTKLIVPHYPKPAQR